MMYGKKVFIVIVLLLFAHIFYRIYTYKDSYLSVYDGQYWKQRYLNSQWVGPSGCNWDPHINPHTCVWDDAWYVAHPVKKYKPVKTESIGDDGLYAYAGWEYINGKDPTLLNAEMPPLGKYLIGFSILVFNNQNVFALLSGILFMASYFLLSYTLLKNKSSALFVVAIFSFEQLFYTQLRAPFLDLLYVAFIFLILYFVLKDLPVFSSVFLGFAMATKAGAATFTITVVVCALYFFITKKKDRVKSLAALIVPALLFYVLTYARYFLQGHNFLEFLKVQKWVLHFYASGAKGTPGAVFEMIFFGKWISWFGDNTFISEWNIFWIVSFLATLLFLALSGKRRAKDAYGEFLLIFLWIGIYLLFLQTIAVFPRYLLALLPFLYVCAIGLLQRYCLQTLKKR